MDDIGSFASRGESPPHLRARTPASAIGLLALALVSGQPACAQQTTEAAAHVEEDPIPFVLVPQALQSDEVQVFNGKPPVLGDWSSIAVSGSASSTCTAAFVGRFVVLTAAHCVVRGGMKSASPIQIGPLKFTCAADPIYLSAGDASVRHPADYALCTALPYDGPLPDAFNDIRWDALDLRPVKKEDWLLVAGFGCITWKFNSATNRIEKGPVQNNLAVGDFKVLQVRPETFTSASDGKTQPALCSGDSGGPALHGVTSQNPSATRSIRGIASRVDPEGGMVISSFVSLSTERFRRFLECWRGRNPDTHIQVKTPDGQSLEARTCPAAPPA